MFDWDDARYFLAVHRARSLSAAARQLKVNQSTAGRRIAALEKELGVLLFNRTSSGLFLTPAGERFLSGAERIEEETIAAARALSGQEMRLTGEVRFTTPDALGPVFMTPLIAEFHARYPDIELEMIADNRRLNLSKREADLAVRTARPKESSMVTRRLGLLGYALYASAAYAKTRGTNPNDEFMGHDLITSEDRWAMTDWLETNGRKGRFIFKSNSSVARLEAAHAGIGLAVLPCYLADVHPELLRVLPVERVFTQEIWLIFHKDLRHAARVRVLVEFLARAFEKHTARLTGTSRSRRKKR